MEKGDEDKDDDMEVGCGEGEFGGSVMEDEEEGSLELWLVLMGLWRKEQPMVHCRTAWIAPLMSHLSPAQSSVVLHAAFA